MSGGPAIGGAPIVTLTAQDAPAQGPAILEAQVLPGRGMMLLQARLRLASGEVVEALHAPPPVEAAQALDGGPKDRWGNASFSFGGAILAPYANRIRGRLIPGADEIETRIGGRPARLPANWSGKAPGAERYAMHGLILDARVPFEQSSRDRVTGRLEAGDFEGRWPGRLRLDFEWRLASGGLDLTVTASNSGDQAAPVGVGWHPYFALPSGDRAQARVRLPAARRAEVGDYDAVLPTGRLLAAEDGYDLSDQRGAALGDRYYDDCFTDLIATHGLWRAQILDPASNLGLRISSPSPPVRAAQLYAPPDQAFVVLEPQFNLPDPYGDEWPPEIDTGMVSVGPGRSVTYAARVEPFAA